MKCYRHRNELDIFIYIVKNLFQSLYLFRLIRKNGSRVALTFLSQQVAYQQIKVLIKAGLWTKFKGEGFCTFEIVVATNFDYGTLFKGGFKIAGVQKQFCRNRWCNRTLNAIKYFVCFFVFFFNGVNTAFNRLHPQCNGFAEEPENTYIILCRHFSLNIGNNVQMLAIIDG